MTKAVTDIRLYELLYETDGERYRSVVDPT